MFVLFALPFPVLGLMLAARLDPEQTKVMIGALVIFATWKPKGWKVGWGEGPAFAAVGVVAN